MANNLSQVKYFLSRIIIHNPCCIQCIANPKYRFIGLSSDASSLLASTLSTWSLFQSPAFSLSTASGSGCQDNADVIAGCVLFPVNCAGIIEHAVAVLYSPSGTLKIFKASICLFTFTCHACIPVGMKLDPRSFDLLVLFSDGTLVVIDSQSLFHAINSLSASPSFLKYEFSGQESLDDIVSLGPGSFSFLYRYYLVVFLLSPGIIYN
jgi:hypothetical protein